MSSVTSASGLARFPLLWFARARYRTAGPPSDPDLRDAWEFGRARGEAGSATPGDLERIQALSSDEREAFWNGRRAVSDRPAAPLWWPQELVLLATEAGVHAIVGDDLPTVVCLMPLKGSFMSMRLEAERRRARKLGLTAQTAPQVMVPWEFTVVVLTWQTYVRLRGLTLAPETWERAFARSIIRELQRRQAWRRVYVRTLI